MTDLDRLSGPELSRRLAAVRARHVPAKKSGNLAAPRCAECGFPSPCPTRQIIDAPQSTETPPRPGRPPRPAPVPIVAMSPDLRSHLGYTEPGSWSVR